MLTVKSAPGETNTSTLLEESREADRTRTARWLGGAGKRDEIRYESILACPGSSAAAADVVAWAIRMARVNAAALHVIDVRQSSESPPAAEGGAAGAAGEQGAASARLRTLISTTREAIEVTPSAGGSAPEIQVKTGGEARRIADTLDRSLMDLVVVAAEDFLASDGPIANLVRRGLRRRSLNVLLVKPSETRKLERVTACIDFSRSAYTAALQATRLAHAYGAALEFLHLYHLPAIEWETVEWQPVADPIWHDRYERISASEVRQWMQDVGLDPGDHEIVCRDAPNWDYSSSVTAGIANEQADLVVFPMPKHTVLVAQRDARIIARIASATKGSLLVVRR